MNFVVYFIFSMLLVATCKKPHSKIVHGSLAILGSLSTCKVTKIDPLRKFEIAFNSLDYNLALSSEITFCIHIKEKTAYIFSLRLSLYFIFFCFIHKNE